MSPTQRPCPTLPFTLPKWGGSLAGSTLPTAPHPYGGQGRTELPGPTTEITDPAPSENGQGQLLIEVRAARRLPSPERARAIREAAHVSQQRMADELGVDRVTFLRWEAGTAQPHAGNRLKYAVLLAAIEEELRP